MRTADEAGRLLEENTAQSAEIFNSQFLLKCNSAVYFTAVGSHVCVAKAMVLNLPAKDARLSCFNTQPGAEGFKAGVFQQFHCCL